MNRGPKQIHQEVMVNEWGIYDAYHAYDALKNNEDEYLVSNVSSKPGTDLEKFDATAPMTNLEDSNPDSASILDDNV